MRLQEGDQLEAAGVGRAVFRHGFRATTWFASVVRSLGRAAGRGTATAGPYRRIGSEHGPEVTYFTIRHFKPCHIDSHNSARDAMVYGLCTQ